MAIVTEPCLTDMESTQYRVHCHENIDPIFLCCTVSWLLNEMFGKSTRDGEITSNRLAHIIAKEIINKGIMPHLICSAEISPVK